MKSRLTKVTRGLGNPKKSLIVLAAVVLFFGGKGALRAQYGTHNRPNPLMDYVPQEIGIYDTVYWELKESDCRSCHGNSLADRHHLTDTVLISGLCTPCHDIVAEPPYVVVIRDCLTSGCHSWNDVDTNGWHHNTDLSASGNCVACHDPNLVEALFPVADLEMYPPSIVSPTPFSCENCHWRQDQVPGVDANSPGHPSAYDHYDGWGNFLGFHEYSTPIYDNFETHHMGYKGNVYSECYRCHSEDPYYPDWDPYNPELIRYCEKCHSARTLHSIGPHVQYTNGWEALGFHVPFSNTQSRDVDPVIYRTWDPAGPYVPETQPGFTSDRMCRGCHGDALPDWDPEIPPCSPVIDSMSPIAGTCGTIVTIRGLYFGSENTSERSVKMRPASGGVWVDVPIHAWTDTLIEWVLPCWTFSPGNYRLVVVTETGNSSPLKVFSVRDHPTLLNVSPGSGPCRQVLTLSGSGGFDTQRERMAGDGYHGLTHVVDFVGSSGTYTATRYSAPAQWTNTQFQTMFGDVFEDQTDPITGERNLVRDSEESLIRRCEDCYLGPYSVYVKSIYFGDEDGSGGFSAGDTIFQVSESDPVQFELTKKPVIYKLNPNRLERSHYCGTYLVNNILTIYGQNFGPTQGPGDVVRIGTTGQYGTDPFTKGIVLPRVLWGSLNIKVGVDKPHVPGAAVGRDNVVVWVVKDGVPTNALPIEILPDTPCP